MLGFENNVKNTLLYDQAKVITISEKCQDKIVFLFKIELFLWGKLSIITAISFCRWQKI